MSVDSIPDEELLRRAVKGARSNKTPWRGSPRWVAVMETFGLGSTYSAELCRRFDLDPYETVKPS
ncbi:hypothetical protein [Bradyrhizobium cenepequi]|uniref:hypothetical protein n=1 Tax=Bradyrhizobium cenepequi TaxID=2821403 RepID=UPI001CE285C8|nr:hypothetical protein [Bradyrhizobium cenepequi]MCA6108166.1 hypothetical protein [Bradyrhizobium cenepequi]